MAAINVLNSHQSKLESKKKKQTFRPTLHEHMIFVVQSFVDRYGYCSLETPLVSNPSPSRFKLVRAKPADVLH